MSNIDIFAAWPKSLTTPAVRFTEDLKNAAGARMLAGGTEASWMEQAFWKQRADFITAYPITN